MIDEIWKTIPAFQNYQVSNLGRIFNTRNNVMMKVSETTFGHLKITLKAQYSHRRYTRGVATLVAEAFVEPPNVLCDQVVILDGDLWNVAAHNLVWRPRWLAWKYTHQMKNEQPLHYQNLPIRNIETGKEYDSIIQVGIEEGLLFDDIWKSTYTGLKLFPDGFMFEVLERV